ncbi:MAG TPA: hypothetical protein ENI23_17645 [bacterium]|nr:hypothetical protein [bacterium]
MSDIPKELTLKEVKEIEDFLKEKEVDIQIHYNPQRVRRIEDGSLIIDAPLFTTKFVKIKPDTGKNGNSKNIETT